MNPRDRLRSVGRRVTDPAEALAQQVTERVVDLLHRALHDLIAGTAVIYAWDARAARLRFMTAYSDRFIGEPSARPPGEPVPKG